MGVWLALLILGTACESEVIAENTVNGVTVGIVEKNFSTQILGYRLSDECGENLERCQNIFMEHNANISTIINIPLNKALALGFT